MFTQNWNVVYQESMVDGKVAALQNVLEKLTAAHFELKTTTRRESDLPLVNTGSNIKRLWKKRHKVYDREGRSDRWKSLKRKSDKLYRKRAGVYMQKQKDILTAPDASRSFYKNVKAYQSKEKPVEFGVRNLYDGKSHQEVAKELADHFNAVSQEFQGLTETPPSYSSPLPPIPRNMIEKRLRDFRKPKSMVKGDIFPQLVNRGAPHLSLPLVDIYNLKTLVGVWPTLWKIEYVTPIRKKFLPEGPDDLRNISCTLLLSKIYESFVLDWLGGQVTIRTNQFGGVKGFGTERYLVKLWQQILENLEDPGAASLITSIDYAKAFNRLDFDHCLCCLAAKGACKEILSIISTFLSGRQITVKIGSAFSDMRSVLGGVPQGSLLGVLLFNISVDDFEAYSPDLEQYNPREDYTLDDIIMNEKLKFEYCH